MSLFARKQGSRNAQGIETKERSMITPTTIWNNALAPRVSTDPTHPTATSPSASASDSSSDASTISSNDFLTLLVTEMKNQDPTSATDPNQYINQLVSVNSLEQLIQINQTLGGMTPTTGSGTDKSSTAAVPGFAAQTGAAASQSASTPTVQPVQFGRTHFPAAVTQGNLGVPITNPAAQTVAQALSGRAHL
jgi:flagellar basal-body rod modification protein FlgD